MADDWWITSLALTFRKVMVAWALSKYITRLAWVLSSGYWYGSMCVSCCSMARWTCVTILEGHLWWCSVLMEHVPQLLWNVCLMLEPGQILLTLTVRNQNWRITGIFFFSVQTWLYTFHPRQHMQIIVRNNPYIIGFEPLTELWAIHTSNLLQTIK